MPQVANTSPRYLGRGDVWVTESKSRPGKNHITVHREEGQWDCTCEGNRYHKHCRHIEELQQEAGEDTDDFEVSL